MQSASKRVGIWNAGARVWGVALASICQHAEPMLPPARIPPLRSTAPLSPHPTQPSDSSAAERGVSRFDHARPHAKRLGRLLRGVTACWPLPEPCVCCSGTASGVRAVQGIQFCGREQSRIFRRREVGLQAAEQLEKMTKPTDYFRAYKKNELLQLHGSPSFHRGVGSRAPHLFALR